MTNIRPCRADGAALLIVASVWLGGCAATQTDERYAVEGGDAGALDALVAAMSGTFSSAAQAEADSAFRHVVLHITPLPHLVLPPGARWLYVEEAMAATPERPSRQRVYCVRALATAEGTAAFECGDYELHMAERFAGAWRDPSRFREIGWFSFAERYGCEIIFTAVDEGWSGATDPIACRSTSMGAEYETSEVTIRDDVILIWDRGYDAQGNQVWGSVAGPFEFRRQP